MEIEEGAIRPGRRSVWVLLRCPFKLIRKDEEDKADGFSLTPT